MYNKKKKNAGRGVGGEKHPHVLLFWEREQPIWRERGEPKAAAVWEEEKHQLAVGGARSAQGEGPALR